MSINSRKGNNPLKLAVIVSTLGLLALLLSRYFWMSDGIPPNSFGQAQSFLEDDRGAPLLSGNWEGRFRPYRFAENQFSPLLPSSADRSFEDYDFYSPSVFSDGYLLAGQRLGRKSFEIFFFDPAQSKIERMTSDPNADEGDYCISPNKKLVAFRRGGTEQIAVRRNARLESLPSNTLPGFERCLWLSNDRLVGATKKHAPIEINDCNLEQAEWKCRPTSLGQSLSEFQDFYQSRNGTAGFLALQKGAEFRQAFDFSGRLSVMNLKLPGDLLEAQDEAVRIGYQSHYRSNLAYEPQTVLFKLKKIGTEFWAIAGNETTSKTLARLESTRWSLKLPPHFAGTAGAKPIEELWISSAKGEKFQVIRFGEKSSRRFVIWLHGGPHENVSPRFNPYFHELNRRGYSVLALNYPGSTGRGRSYELQDEHKERLLASANTLFEFLRSQKPERVLIWSVSAGSYFTKLLLESEFPLSAVVDQAGLVSKDLTELAKAKNVPLLKVRGQNDIRADEKNLSFDYLYNGGHDITYYPHFRNLFRRFNRFEQKARPWKDEISKEIAGVIP